MEYLHIIGLGVGVLIGLTPRIIDMLSAHPFVKLFLIAVSLFVIINLAGIFINGDKVGFWVVVGMVLVLIANRICGK